MLDRVLTLKQEESLDRLAKRDSKARVVGWDHLAKSPIIVTSKGDYKVVSPVTGYVRQA